MMIIMTLKIITEIVNQIKSNQNKTKEKKETQQQKSNKNTHPEGRKKKTEAVVYNNKNKTKKQNKKKNKYIVTKMEQRDAKGSADSQNLISTFEKHHRCPN